MALAATLSVSCRYPVPEDVIPNTPALSASTSSPVAATPTTEPTTAPTAVTTTTPGPTAVTTTTPGPTTATTPGPTTAPTTAPTTPAPTPSGADSDVRDANLFAISCGQSEAAVAASGAPRVRQGSAVVYIGARQASGNNQDPVMVRFDAGRQTWCHDDYERSGDDGRGYGLLWSGDLLLGVFSATGAQGDAAQDLRRFTGSGWLRSYADASPGGGGGPKVAVVIGIDPATGAGRPGTGTWLTSLNNGKVNSLLVTSLAATGGTVRVGVRSWFAPRGTDRKALTCDGGSPFPLTYTFDAGLTAASAVDGGTRCR